MELWNKDSRLLKTTDRKNLYFQGQGKMYKNDEQEIIFINSAVDSQGLFV